MTKKVITEKEKLTQVKPFRNNLSVDVTDIEAVRLPKVALIKYDGVYALVRDGKLLGRSLKPFKNEYITMQLSHPKYEGLVGELCAGRQLNADNLCRNTTSKVNTIKGEWGYTWVIFDYIGGDYINKPYKERIKKAMEVVVGMGQDNIRMAKMEVAYDHDQIEGLYGDALDDGYEGLILRDLDALWKNGRSTAREQGFMRMKPQSDKEAVIIGVVEGMTNNNEAKINELGYTERSSHQENKVGNGMVGSWKAVDLTTGVEINIGAGKLTHEGRAKYFNEQPIGAIVKYRSFDIGVKSLPRFPRHISFRADEDMENALLEKVDAIRKSYGLI